MLYSLNFNLNLPEQNSKIQSMKTKNIGVKYRDFWFNQAQNKTVKQAIHLSIF